MFVMGFPNRETQFKPGRSGNPSGRPKGSRNNAAKLFELIEKTFRKKYPGPEDLPPLEFCKAYVRARRPKLIVYAVAYSCVSTWRRYREAEFEKWLREAKDADL
jgi:hypothetical protein